jgi:ABC-2 type transport system permease protein
VGARAILAITINNFRQISHDRRTVGMIVIMPILFILLFGFTFAGEPENIRTIVVNEDEGVVGTIHSPLGDIPLPLNISEFVIENLDSKTFNLAHKDDIDEAVGDVENGKAWAVIHFPDDFSQGVVNWVMQGKNETIFHGYNVSFDVVPVEDANMTVHIDGSSSQVSGKILAEVRNAISKTIQEQNPEMSFSSLISADFVYGENVRFIDFFAPGIMGLTVTMITIILTIVSFVRERRNGTLDRLFVSPVKPGDIVLGYTATFSIIALLQSVELLVFAILIFDIAFVGSVLLALGLIVLYAVGMLGLGVLLSTLAKNEFQAIQFVPLVFVPSIILSGILWPIEAMPELVRPISSAIPLTYLADALRSVMIRGWGPAEIWVDIVALLIFALLMLVGSILLVNKKANRLGLKKEKEE